MCRSSNGVSCSPCILNVLNSPAAPLSLILHLSRHSTIMVFLSGEAMSETKKHGRPQRNYKQQPTLSSPSSHYSPAVHSLPPHPLLPPLQYSPDTRAPPPQLHPPKL